MKQTLKFKTPPKMADEDLYVIELLGISAEFQFGF